MHQEAESLYAPPRRVEHVEDSWFYHLMDVPDHGMVGGVWDLRGRENSYLGGIELAGRRVLEIGPASGYMTFHMESRGAEVVAVELGPDVEWDFVPHAQLDLDAIKEQSAVAYERRLAAFWFAHERFGSHARVHYGSAYDLSSELGQFDVAVLASVLLHTRDPLRVIEQCARLANRVVVTDAHVAALDGQPVARLEPTIGSDNWHTWWHFSPELIVRFFGVLGFGETKVTYHEQCHVVDGREQPFAMFTVVATRTDDGQ